MLTIVRLLNLSATNRACLFYLPEVFSMTHIKRHTEIVLFLGAFLASDRNINSRLHARGPGTLMFSEKSLRNSQNNTGIIFCVLLDVAAEQVDRREMALVLMCGQPCSGKSTAADCLMRALKSHACNVRIIDESCLHLDRNQSYADMPSEKNLRGVLRSEVDRSISKDNIIIVDSLNNIKGYRYELWCLARAAGTRYCVLHCDVEERCCNAWNKARQEQEKLAYNDKIFEDLVRRFEKPDRRNRWDSPLFELKPSEEQIQESSLTILEAVSFLTKKIDSKSRDVRTLQPTIATQNVRTSDTNSLYELDRATQEVINSLVEAQAQGFGGPVNSVTLGEGLPAINIQRSVGLPELRRLRRTFVKLTGQSSLSGPPPPSDAYSAKRMFADYLNRELGTA